MLYWKGVRQMFKLGEIKMYSPADVCEALHIGRVKCLKMFNMKEFNAVKLGNRLLVSEQNLTKFLNSGKEITLHIYYYNL